MIPGPVIYFRFFFADSIRAVFSLWRVYVHLVPRNKVVRLTDLPDITIDVDVKQQNNNNYAKGGEVLYHMKPQQNSNLASP